MSMLLRLKQWACDHEKRIGDVRQCFDVVTCRCIKCGMVLVAESGIALPGRWVPDVPVAEAMKDEWYCEQHPESLMGHDGCCGAGIQENTRIHMLLNKLRLAQQETRETAMVRNALAAQLRRNLGVKDRAGQNSESST